MVKVMLEYPKNSSDRIDRYKNKKQRAASITASVMNKPSETSVALFDFAIIAFEKEEKTKKKRKRTKGKRVNKPATHDLYLAMLRLAHYVPKGKKGEKKKFYGYVQAGKCKHVVTTWAYLSTQTNSAPIPGAPSELKLEMVPIDPRDPAAVYALDVQDMNCVKVITLTDNDMMPILRPVVPIPVDGGGFRIPEADLNVVLGFIEGHNEDPLAGLNSDSDVDVDADS